MTVAAHAHYFVFPPPLPKGGPVITGTCACGATSQGLSNFGYFSPTVGAHISGGGFYFWPHKGSAPTPMELDADHDD